MVRRFAFLWLSIAGVTLLAAHDQAQPQRKIDFVRDVQPIFRQQCYDCHGPSQQMNGFRLDRRRDAFRGGTIPVIGPGNSDGSRLYQKLIGDKYGRQMPPTGALPPEQISTIRAWIDEGAEWPDNASGESAPPPADLLAVKLVTAAESGDLRGFAAMAAANPKALSLRGPAGTTPLMAAVLNADAQTVRQLLDAGADPNAKNDAGATALMWAAGDPAKTAALVDHGADVNAKSADGRTPLLIAAGARGGTAAVRLLIEHGANVNVEAPTFFGETSALTEAAIAGNEESFKALVAAGANLKAAGPPALGLAMRAQCMPCAQILLQAFDERLVTATMIGGGPPLGPAFGTPMLLDRGAVPTATDHDGRTMLMLAAASETMPVDAVKALLARGVDVNARTSRGETALGLARRHGRTPIVELLTAAGAKADDDPPPPAPAPAASARAAVERSLPLLQKTDGVFLDKAGCVSCHNNSLTAMSVAAARQAGFAVDETLARRQRDRIGAYLETWRERAQQGIGIPGFEDTASYILLGLAAEGYPRDRATDAQVRLISRAQTADGRWRILANRPPIESSDIEVTSAALRSLKVYGPTGPGTDTAKRVGDAAAWLEAQAPRSTEDHAFRLLGLIWAGAEQSAIAKAARALVAEQRPDGGWAQIPPMESDAYATGQALTALNRSGVLPSSDPALKRGRDFLLKTQLADGSWYVRSRAIPLQPLFDAGFPHGRDAFISVAATNWATMALVDAR
jgi:ankyrin repeat protein